MKKLLFTDNIGYDMSDWQKERIAKVYAGTNCIMAITEDGRTLQKTVTPEYASRTKYWTRVRQIAVSGWAPCHAIGLISDGTCLISKRFVRSWCKNHSDSLPFDTINDEVKSWSEIRQVAVSDSFFGLDRSGRVRIAPLSDYERRDYEEVRTWENVARIVTANQNGVLGIREDGTVVCAGTGLTRNERVRRRIAALKDVADICTTGSECEEIVVAFQDGHVSTLDGRTVSEDAGTGLMNDGMGILKAHFNYEIIIQDSGKRIVRWAPQKGGLSEVFRFCPPISSFAIGDCNYGDPFVIAVSEE